MARSKTLPSPVASAQDTVLLPDCSGSMGAPDYPPSRLDAAKTSGVEFAEVRVQISPDDRMAVVSFGDKAVRHCSLIPLRKRWRQLMKAIQTVDLQGCTAMGRGLVEAERVLNSNRGSWLSSTTGRNVQQRIILLTDGYHNEGRKPLPIATRLKKAGVLIDCIGIGGTPSDVDSKLLRKIASRDDDGKPRYRFIKDRAELLEHFRQLATSITR